MSKSEYSADKALELAKYINNIKELKGLGLNQLALLANMDGAALHKILHGTVKKVNPFHLQAIAKVLRIDYRILYKIVEYLDSEDEIVNVENLGIPIYSGVEFNGSMIFGNILEYINISSLINSDNFFGLAIYDDSMNPTIQKNSSVIIEKTENLKDKDIGLFSYMGNTILRKIWLTENETVLVSENTDFPPIIIKDPSFSILGKVRHILHKL